MFRDLCFLSIFALSNMCASSLTVVEGGVKKHAPAFLNFSGLETERLIVRKLKPTDVDDIFALTSDPEITKLTPKFEVAQTRDDAQRYIDRIISNYSNGMPEPWAIVYKENGRVVGIVCLDISSRYRGEVSYAITRNYWSKGIATEAARAVIAFGFKTLGLKRIAGVCDPRNAASIRVLEKCSMQYEGLLRSYYCVQGQFCDRMVYAVINPQ